MANSVDAHEDHGADDADPIGLHRERCEDRPSEEHDRRNGDGREDVHPIEDDPRICPVVRVPASRTAVPIQTTTTVPQQDIGRHNENVHRAES